MVKRDSSLSVRFGLWWVIATGIVIAVCAIAYHAREVDVQEQQLRQEMLELAAVIAPRVRHDIQTHIASYAHQSLHALEATREDTSFRLYGKTGTLLFSTHPVFRRSQEIPEEVSQSLADQQPRWTHLAGDDNYHAFFPMAQGAEKVGVIQITRKTQDLYLGPMRRTMVLIAFCVLVAGVASLCLLLFMRRHYFRPLKELNGMLTTINQPAHSKTPLEIPSSEFHGELAALYRNASELAQNMVKVKKAMEGRAEVKGALDKIQEETRFLAQQIYERKIDKLDTFPGYEILSKPVHIKQWGTVWKNSVTQGTRKVVFSYWHSKNDGLNAVLQGFQWDEILQGLVRTGKNLDEISDEMFMEFGLDLKQWFLGQWDAYDRRLEIMGNVWVCQWDHAKEEFSYLQNAKPLTGTQKQGHWAHWSLNPGDKLILANADAFEIPDGAGIDAFLGLLSKNIKSSPQNLLDLLFRELSERRFLAPDSNLLLVIHSALHAGVNSGQIVPVTTYPKDTIPG